MMRNEFVNISVAIVITVHLNGSIFALVTELRGALEKRHVLVNSVVGPRLATLKAGPCCCSCGHLGVVALAVVPHPGPGGGGGGAGEGGGGGGGGLAQLLYGVGPPEHASPDLGPDRLRLPLGFPPHKLPDDDLLVGVLLLPAAV